uniref:DUF4283 domain-containing protein n=2 Tax=Nicotiana TaxID=4085 RepID=A0A1S4BZZ5_TOBAC|nr:PREDICTED: uncharacterized protein LOC107813694 [Nicotiana tabacum]
MVKALHLGLWFISGNFLSVRKWEPKFVPQEATLTSTTIWIWLPQLPTEFYDQDILEKVGRKLGKLLKIDQCTSSTLRGRYARICIQVPLETPVETSIIIGDHKQVVIYEGEGTLCTICGRIGHTAHICNYRAPTPTATHEPQDDHQRKAVISEKSEWKTVTFPRRRKQGQLKTINTNEGKMNKPQHASRTEEIQVNMFNANSDLMKEDPAAEPVFVTIDQPTQNNPSSSAPKRKSNSPPLQNIHKGISKALEILKKKNASEEPEMPYATPRMDSILLDSRKSPPLQMRGVQGPKSPREGTHQSPTAQMMNYIIWNVRDGNNAEFKWHCLEMVKMYKPAMLVLFETKMADHQSLAQQL